MTFTIDYKNKFIAFLCLLPSCLVFLLLISGLNLIEWLGLMIVGQIILQTLYNYIVLDVFELQMWKGYWLLFSLQLICVALSFYFVHSSG